MVTSPAAPTGHEETNAEVVDFLSNPRTYGIAGPVERIDTHISIVFLAGARALKLKRAVCFDYLDYSTLALRRRYCDVEVATNRRTAPDLYEGVVAVTRAADGALALDGPGEVVEWLVAMRRFDQDCLFDRMAARGALTAPLMRRLADAVAVFHAGANSHARIDGADVMRRVVAGNRRGIARRAGETFETASAEHFFAALDSALAACTPVLEARARGGSIRACHGDLHLRNICLLDGTPTLFDAIEFNDALSEIDVLYDLAFLVMDLVHRDLGALANLVFNRYLQRTEDYGGVAALPLFLACRAAVRAHTAAAAADAQSDPADAARLYDEARQYLDLGIRFLDRASPRLVVVGGLSGSGKTALAGALAPVLDVPPGGVHLQSDTIRKLMFSRDPEARLDAAAYAEDVSRAVYDRLHERAAACLAAGRGVVCDATYMEPGQRRAVEAVAAAARVPFTAFWLEATAETMMARVRTRRDDASDADEMVLGDQQRGDVGALSWSRLAAGGEIEDTVRAARAVLDDESLAVPPPIDIKKTPRC